MRHKIVSNFFIPGLLLLLCLSFSAQARAVEYSAQEGGFVPFSASPSDAPDPGNGETPDLTGGTVIRFNYERVFSSFKLEPFRNDELFLLYNLMDYISNALDCTIQLPNGKIVTSACTAVWNDGEFPLDTAGIYYLTATLIPPEGCTFGDGVRTRIILPVKIYDPELSDVRITSVEEWLPGRIAIALPKDSPIEAVVNHVDLTNVRLSFTDESGGEYNGLTVNWDFSQVDMDTPGLYTVSGTLVPPPGTMFGDGLSLPEPVFTLSVQIPGRPQIDSTYRGRREIRFPWLLTEEQAKQADSFEIWMSAGGVWSKLHDQYHIGPDYLAIALSAFPVGEACQIQVDYPGGQTGIATITYDGTTLDCDYSQGDRDGGDTGGSRPPDLVLPPPSTTPSLPDDEAENKGSGGNAVNPQAEDSPPALPSQAESQPETETAPPFRFPSEKTAALPFQQFSPAASHEAPLSAQIPLPSGAGQTVPETEEALFLERFGETYSILSGTRLRRMAEDSGRAEFSKQEVMVSISKEALEALKIVDRDEFHITIRRINPSCFSFSVERNGVPIANLPDTRIMLPYDSQTPDNLPSLTLAEKGTDNISVGSFDPRTGIAAFTADTGGEFTILEERNADVAPVPRKTSTVTPVPLSLTIAGGLLFLGLGGAYLLKRSGTK